MPAVRTRERWAAWTLFTAWAGLPAPEGCGVRRYLSTPFTLPHWRAAV